MTDTPQPAMAGETVVASDPIQDAANAFKVSLGQAEAPERQRDESGRFTSSAPEAAAEEEINTEEGDEPEAVASDAEADDSEDAADEAQQSAIDMPASWGKEDAEIWSELPPEVQGRIAEREGQRDTAVNQKFQEAANARKVYETSLSEVQTSREKAVEAIDLAIGVIRARMPSPSLSMLDVNSSDYDPDNYHLQFGEAKQLGNELEHLAAQRDYQIAQGQTDAKNRVAAQDAAINEAWGPALIEAYPEIKDQAKNQTFFNELAEWSIKAGLPATMFQNLPNAAEWHMLADARSWREHKSALAKVKADPKPEPRKAQPAVRPGVTTPKSTIAAADRQKAFDRLGRTGSIEDGAAIWKQFLK